MKNCSNCGAELKDEAKFCGKCGTAQAEQPAYQQPAYQQPTYQQPTYQQPAYQQPAYQQPAYQQPAYQQPAQPAIVPGKGMAIASMVLGIVSLALFCVSYLAIPCGIVGAVLGAIARSKAVEVGAKNGMANAGIACSCVALGLALLIVILAIIGMTSSVDYMIDLF